MPLQVLALGLELWSTPQRVGRVDTGAMNMVLGERGCANAALPTADGAAGTVVVHIAPVYLNAALRLDVANDPLRVLVEAAALGCSVEPPARDWPACCSALRPLLRRRTGRVWVAWPVSPTVLMCIASRTTHPYDIEVLRARVEWHAGNFSCLDTTFLDSTADDVARFLDGRFSLWQAQNDARHRDLFIPDPRAKA